MRKNTSLIFSVFTSALLTNQAYANDAFDLYSLPLDVLSKIKISTGTEVVIGEAPAVATLITNEDIKALGALTLDDVLKAVPGMHVIPSTLNRTLPVYTFRGLYSGQNQQVMFMLNGYRIDGDLYASAITHLSRMNVNFIDRIEVVRGPGSAIYGADAYSGVVNIVTKSSDELNGVKTGVLFGSQNTHNAWLQYGQHFDNDWALVTNFEYFKRDSNSHRTVNSDFQSSFDALFGSTASLTPGYIEDRMEAYNYNIHLSNRHFKFGIDGYSKRNSGVGVGAGQSIDPVGKDTLDQYLLSVHYKSDKIFDHWSIESKLSYFFIDSQAEFNIFPSGTILPVGNDGNIFTPHDGKGCLTANIPGIGCLTTFSDGYKGNPGSESEISTFELTAFYQQLNNHNVRISFGTKEEDFHGFESKNFGPGVLDKITLNGQANPVLVDGTLTYVENTPYIYAPDKTRRVNYFSLQDIWQINKNWALTSGIRYDNYSDFGSTVNPRFALVWSSLDKLIVKILYGEAFRAPSFSELYSQNNPVSVGNTQLKPETIDTTELSFNYKWSKEISANLNLYHYETKDMIQFITNAEGVGRAQNYQSLTGKGAEIEFDWLIAKHLQLSTNYAYQDTENTLTNEQVEFVPKHQMYIDTRWQINADWRLSSQFQVIKERSRASDDLRQTIDDYQLMNLTLRRSNIDIGSIGNELEFSLIIKNLFDEKGYEPSDGRITNDYPIHDRRIYAGISLTL